MVGVLRNPFFGPLLETCSLTIWGFIARHSSKNVQNTLFYFLLYTKIFGDNNLPSGGRQFTFRCQVAPIKKVHFGPWMESITGSFPFCSRLIAVFTSPRSFPSSKKSHFQNEAKCKTFFVAMSFIYLKIKNCFHSNGFAVASL